MGGKQKEGDAAETKAADEESRFNPRFDRRQLLFREMIRTDGPNVERTKGRDVAEGEEAFNKVGRLRGSVA